MSTWLTSTIYIQTCTKTGNNTLLIVSCMPQTTHSGLCENHRWLYKLHLVHLCGIKREEWRCLQLFNIVHVWLPLLLLCTWVFLYKCVCVLALYFYLAWLHCVLSKSKLFFVFLLLLFCYCVLWVLLSLAFPHLTIYSKVSFSGGLQGNDTEDYCLDQ